MPPSRDEDDPHLPHDEELNPFVAFRRFADEQMASFWHNVFGLPLSSPSSTLPRSRYNDEDWQRKAAEGRQRSPQETNEQLRIVNAVLKAQYKNNGIESPAVDEDGHAYRHTGFGWINNPPEMEDIRGLLRLASQEVPRGESNVERTDSAQRGSDQEVMRCPYRPANQEVPLRNQAPPSSSNTPSYETTPSTVSLPFSRLMGGPIYGYLLWSPYSPLRLEQDFSLRDHPVEWRRAFEDLMGMQIKGDLPDPERLEKGPFGHWKSRVGKSLQIYQRNSGRMDVMDATDQDSKAESDEVTELDLYERFLGTQYPQVIPSTPTSTPTSNADPTTSHPSAAPILADNPNPTIISTLTTTERNTLPDGSVHTKVMLKKRFTDGREESTETVHTTYGSQTEGPGPAKPFVVGEAKDAPKKEASEGIAPPAKKKGWFWS